ncbi:aminotransferase class V-fold PLP-dependent enzyme [Dankookia sp. P2]|uniref:aminotransferase class V-fold PLP-dependent enzyme n=1 Tax=Dankookia sp. P2 TaxID=3423955 RepID=UPI003D67523D
MQDIRAGFALDPGFLTVNHGSFGATPRPVLAAQADWRARLEAQPSRFMVEVLTPALRAAAARLAGFLGCDADGLGFVDNATAACNAVLRSVPLAPGDEILLLSHAYGAVRKAAAHVAAGAGARIVDAPCPSRGRRQRRLPNRSPLRLPRAPGWRCWTTSPPPAPWSCRSRPWSPLAGRAACRCWWTARMGPGNAALGRRARRRLVCRQLP